MTAMLHRPRRLPVRLELQRAELRSLTTSEAAARRLAENYTGLQTGSPPTLGCCSGIASMQPPNVRRQIRAVAGRRRRLHRLEGTFAP